MRSDVGKAVSAVYFISWIFIGNFVLLNLFLAILLDSFIEEDEEEHKEQALEVEQQKEEKPKKPVSAISALLSQSVTSQTPRQRDSN